MRQTQIFSGSSHPNLVEDVCSRLGQTPGKVELGKFSNGETKVNILTSIRDQDVFIIQSGSSKINDNVIELLIMVSACRSGSAKSITAVMPYFPYSRQSKKKTHRGSITARMIANLLTEAGVNHVITLDLHSSQMQGFFGCPVDNLVAEPLIAYWIKSNIPDWNKAVVVSKNPGGTKRVTSLADALKLNFGIVMTDRRRPGSGSASIANSVVLGSSNINGQFDGADFGDDEEESDDIHRVTDEATGSPNVRRVNGAKHPRPHRHIARNLSGSHHHASPLSRSVMPEHESHAPRPVSYDLSRIHSAPASSPEGADDENIDTRPRDIITGRLIHGHIVDDDAPSPAISARSSTADYSANRTGSDDELPDHMLSSFISATSSHRQAENALGGSADAVGTSDEEEEELRNPEVESTVTLVGKVRDRPVLIVDDIIDKPTSWIAAAETVVKRGGATKVYCIATHGLFGDDCLEEMEACACIDRIIVTNAFPIPRETARMSTKLKILDVSHLLAEAIRRNHHGESISALFQHYD